jgi:UDP-galactopyranose mutase
MRDALLYRATGRLRMAKRILIVGAGLFGAVCGRELKDAGYPCLVIERRNHIGGNCFSVYEPEAAIPFTRIIEHKHFDMSFDAPKTVITREFPEDWAPGATPYYPVNTLENQDRLQRYQQETIIWR